MNFIDKQMIRLGYNQFDGVTGPGIYSPVDGKAQSTEQGIYHIIINFAVYAAAVGLLATFIYMMVAGHDPEKRKDSKDKIMRNCLIVILIFGAIEIVALIQKIAF